MTRLMSFWAMPTLAANTAVVPPITPTTASAAGAYSNIGDSRHTIKTPAVTIVAAWISAETGVGPSIASGSQVWRPSWADFPMAPTNSSRQSRVIVSTVMPAKWIVDPAIDGAAARIAGIDTVPNTR